MINFIKRFNLAIGLSLAILSILFGLYTHFHPSEKEISLAFYQHSVFDAFQMNKKVESLDVFYKGKDIQKDSLNIKVYRLKLLNDGEVDIENQFYDNTLPFGLIVSDGVLLSYNVVGTSDDYIRKNFKYEIKNSSSIEFSKLILDKGSFILFDIMVMHKINKEPKFFPLGKIKGLKKVIIYPEEDSEGITLQSLWKTLLAIFIGIGVLFLLGFIIIFIGVMYFKIVRYFREKHILGLYGFNKWKTLSESQKCLIEIYRKLGKKSFVKIMKEIIDDKSTEIHQENLKIVELVSSCNDLIEKRIIKSKENEKIEYNSIFLNTLEVFMERKLISVSDNKEVKLHNELAEEIVKTLGLIK